MLVKLADRSHNVEDLYNMKIEKIHKYVKETRTWIYPLCAYGKANYPELSNGLTILKNKIRSLTELTENSSIGMRMGNIQNLCRKNSYINLNYSMVDPCIRGFTLRTCCFTQVKKYNSISQKTYNHIDIKGCNF